MITTELRNPVKWRGFYPRIFEFRKCPFRVIKIRIDGCVWKGAVERQNNTFGTSLLR